MPHSWITIEIDAGEDGTLVASQCENCEYTIDYAFKEEDLPACTE